MKALGTIALFMVCGLISGQDISSKIKTSMENHQKKVDSLVAAGKPVLSPCAGPGYTPEGGWLLAVGALLTFTTDAESKDLQRSSLPINATFTSK